MKLNLLPTYVSKEKQSRTAWVASILIALLSVVAALAMIMLSTSNLQKAHADNEEWRPKAQHAVDTANRADVIIAKAAPIIVNTDLAREMIKHNGTYPALYDSLKPFIPSFFRVTSMAAAPADATTSTVTLTGVLKSYQQYADLMVALLRDPEVKSVARSGFQNIDPYIPEITEADQVGRPRRPGEAPIPDDPLQRLAQKQASGTLQGYTNTNNFGSQDPLAVRGAMPGYSLVTITVTMARNLQTPVPRDTLATIATLAAASATASTGGPATGPAGLPGTTPPPPGPPVGGGESPGGAPGRAGRGAAGGAGEE